MTLLKQAMHQVIDELPESASVDEAIEQLCQAFRMKHGERHPLRLAGVLAGAGPLSGDPIAEGLSEVRRERQTALVARLKRYEQE